MKKGQETGLTILISTIVLMIIITSYFIFFVFLPDEPIIPPKSQQQTESEIYLDLITFVKLNSDLITKSVKDNDYSKLEKEIDKLEFEECWELKIKDKIFNKNCNIKDAHMVTMNIPNYNNNQIKIELKVNKNE